MKIGLYLSETGAAGGGMFQYALTVLQALTTCRAHDGCEPFVVYAHDDWHNAVGDSQLDAVHAAWPAHASLIGRLSRLLRLPMATQQALAQCVVPAARKLQQAGCDLVIYPAQDHWTYQFGLPALGTVHDLMHRYQAHFPEVGSRRERLSREYRFQRICRWSRGILVDSEVGREQAVECYGVARDHVHVLPYVAPEYAFRKDKPPDFERRYALPERYIFYPAQFWPHKGHLALFQAMANLAPAHTKLHLVLSGSKTRKFHDLQDAATALGIRDRVHFLGYVPTEDLPELYRRARALVMPTHFGPTNIPPLEAFAAGCPVAASGIYGMPDQLGKAAILFNPNSVEEITDAIQRLWTDDALCRALVATGQKRLEDYGPPQFADRLQKILNLVSSGAN